MEQNISKTGNSQLAKASSDENNSIFAKDEFRFGKRLVRCIAVLITIPLFLFTMRIVQNCDWFSDIDIIVLNVTTLLACIIIVQILVRKIRTIIILATIVGCIILSYNSFFNDNPDAYGWDDAFSGYITLIANGINKQ